jgi:3',5'-cyclic AMP phosphodiesterase CpdA
MAKKKTSRQHAQSTNQTKQINIVHLSDIHFGQYHRFQPRISARGDRLPKRGMPSLAENLLADLKQQVQLLLPAIGRTGTSNPKAFGIQDTCPTIVCATGDFAEAGSLAEFQQATKFLNDFAQQPSIGLNGRDSVFMVPGNHDVDYTQEDVEARWQQYVDFFNRYYKSDIPIDDPWALAKVYDRVDDLGAIILCINSSIYVEKDTPDVDRGQVDLHQLKSIETQLRAIKKPRLTSAIRIALIHHHPVLIPSLVEPNRNYDAVEGSGRLLKNLHKFGFHILLHGHKHYPVTFPSDIRNAFEIAEDSPMMVVAGGSAGSSGLPQPYGKNTYNLITIKWHPAASQTRIRVVTRGLTTHEDATRDELLPQDWIWETLRVDDRSFSAPQKPLNDGSKPPETLPFDKANRLQAEPERQAEYARTRGNFAVTEIRPSLLPGQAYEATCWIATHRPDRQDYERPVKVIWSAGPKLPVKIVLRQQDPTFRVTFNYWGSMLVQAELVFERGPSCFVYAYARIPGR